jgi:transcription elongation factor
MKAILISLLMLIGTTAPEHKLVDVVIDGNEVTYYYESEQSEVVITVRMKEAIREIDEKDLITDLDIDEVLSKYGIDDDVLMSPCDTMGN